MPDTFEGGLDEAQVELAALVAVAHALPQAVPLQDALLEAHHVGVLPPEAGQGPELRQRQLYVLGGVATDPFHRQPGAAAARHRFVHHAVGPAADLGQQAVPRSPVAVATTTTTDNRAGPRRRHRAPPRRPPPRRPLCPAAAAIRRLHGAHRRRRRPPPARPPRGARSRGAPRGRGGTRRRVGGRKSAPCLPL